MCAHGWCGASTETNEPRAVSAMAWTTRAPTLNEVSVSNSESDTLNINMKTRRGVVLGRTPKAQETKEKTLNNH